MWCCLRRTQKLVDSSAMESCLRMAADYSWRLARRSGPWPRQLSRRDAVEAQERVENRCAAAEFDEQFHGFAAAALAENRVQETLAGGAVEDAGFFEGTVGIGGQHFGPQIAVIAGGVTAGEDVREAVRKTVPGGHRHDADVAAHFRERALHEVRTDVGICLHVQAKVQQTEFQLPQQEQAAVEVACA